MISVIIPCLNEELSIADTIKELKSSSVYALEIIVVDNGSTDKTFEVACALGVEVIREPKQGKGFAFRRGLSRVSESSEAIFMIDGDSTYSPAKLDLAHKLIVEMGFDMVVGTRVVSSGNDHAYRFGHRTGNRLLTWISKFTFGSEIEDSLSGWRMFSRGFALSFLGGASRFELEAELNAHAFHLKAAVCNIDVEYRERLEGSFSKLDTFRDGLRILKRKIALWRNERPFRAYSSFAFPWILVSTTLLIRALDSYFTTGLVPKFPSLIVSVGGFIIAVNLWAAGMILERTNLQRVAFARYVYLQESSRTSN